MDMETTASSTTPKKKAPKGAFQDSAGGSFSQKKKVVLGNVKHSGDEKDISLSKARSSGSVYSDVESLSGKNENVSMSGIDEKKWINSKIIKTPVEVSVKKSFALDISLSAVESELAMAKTWLIRKIFSTINGFGKATTFSKFEGIIRSTFILEKSMEMVISLARENKIIVNTDLKKQGVCSDWAVVIKKIPMNTPKNIIVTVVTEFSEIKSIRIQLISMWQKAVGNSVCVAKAVGDRNVWTSRDQFRVLLFTLPVRMTAHDLGTLLKKAGGRTYIINCSLETSNRFHCAVIGFESNEELEFAFLTEPIFGGIRLSWARLDLVQCGKCGHFGHSVLECDASDILPLISSKLLKRSFLGVNYLQLTRLYAKKNVSISRPTVFVVFSASFSSGSLSSSGLFSGSMPPIVSSSSHQIVGLNDCLAVLECSLKILSDQVSVILKKLSFIKLVLLMAPSCAPSLAISVPSAPVVNLDMALDNVLASADSPFSGSSKSANVLSSNGSKVLTSKVGGLESKMFALETSFSSILVRLDLLCSGSGFDLVWKMATCNVHGINIPAKQEDIVCWHFDSGNLILIITETNVQIFSSELDKGFLGAGVAIIMANSLACHVAKIEEIPGHCYNLMVDDSPGMISSISVYQYGFLTSVPP
ncbi:hypothetical protein G9A89_013182 [Geosiphon pyriformis]|nr:hypothetical protein G9A89_013182 [Geosiphon pyriformis]